MDDRIPEDGADDPEIGDSDAGDTAGWVDPRDGEVDYALDDPIAEADFADELVTTDGAAGETVWPGPGGDHFGPTGGQPREAEPYYDEHDPERNPDDGVLTQEDVDEEGI
jgi:hypothetical protein